MNTYLAGGNIEDSTNISINSTNNNTNISNNGIEDANIDANNAIIANFWSIDLMFSLIGSNTIFNIIEYFTFINLFLFFLFIIITLFFVLINSTLLYFSNVNFNHSLMEFISTLFSLLFLIIIISPALIILFDYDLIILPSFIIYSLGLQWAWEFNIIFLPIDSGFSSYCDHYIITTTNRWTLPPLLASKMAPIIAISPIITPIIAISPIITPIIAPIIASKMLIHYHSPYIANIGLINAIIASIDAAINGIISTINANIFDIDINTTINGIIGGIIGINAINISTIYTNNANIDANINGTIGQIDAIKLPFYLWDINTYILAPIYSFIRLFLYSFDVIHTLGFYSRGIKIDAIPGRINLTTTLRLLWKGEYRGKCFESCGQGHLSMILISLIMAIF